MTTLDSRLSAVAAGLRTGRRSRTIPNPRTRTPLHDLTTYGASRAVRLPDYDYAGDADIHLTIHADAGAPFSDAQTARTVCDSIEFCSRKLNYRLYGYCLMPNHVHILFSPGQSGVPLKSWLRDFKSFTTNQHMKRAGLHLWQRSGNDHVCRTGETAEAVLTYIVNNPVRAGLVDRWQVWPWTRIFIEI